MTSIPSPTHDAVASSRGTAPLLFTFLIPLLAVVGLVLWIGSSLTWLAVGVAVAAIAGFTALVMLMLGRLLGDEDGA